MNVNTLIELSESYKINKNEIRNKYYLGVLRELSLYVIDIINKVINPKRLNSINPYLLIDNFNSNVINIKTLEGLIDYLYKYHMSILFYILNNDSWDFDYNRFDDIMTDTINATNEYLSNEQTYNSTSLLKIYRIRTDFKYLLIYLDNFKDLQNNLETKKIVEEEDHDGNIYSYIDFEVDEGRFKAYSNIIKLFHLDYQMSYSYNPCDKYCFLKDYERVKEMSIYDIINMEDKKPQDYLNDDPNNIIFVEFDDNEGNETRPYRLHMFNINEVFDKTELIVECTNPNDLSLPTVKDTNIKEWYVILYFDQIKSGLPLKFLEYIYTQYVMGNRIFFISNKKNLNRTSNLKNVEADNDMNIFGMNIDTTSGSHCTDDTSHYVFTEICVGTEIVSDNICKENIVPPIFYPIKDKPNNILTYPHIITYNDNVVNFFINIKNFKVFFNDSGSFMKELKTHNIFFIKSYPDKINTNMVLFEIHTELSYKDDTNNTKCVFYFVNNETDLTSVSYKQILSPSENSITDDEFAGRFLFSLFITHFITNQDIYRDYFRQDIILLKFINSTTDYTFDNLWNGDDIWRIKRFIIQSKYSYYYLPSDYRDSFDRFKSFFDARGQSKAFESELKLDSKLIKEFLPIYFTFNGRGGDPKTAILKLLSIKQLTRDTQTSSNRIISDMYNSNNSSNTYNRLLDRLIKTNPNLLSIILDENFWMTEKVLLLYEDKVPQIINEIRNDVKDYQKIEENVNTTVMSYNMLFL